MSMGVAIVGTGWVSGEHIRAFQANPNTEVRAIVSRDKARAATKAAQHNLPGARACDHLEEVLEDPEIHVVSICTPHHLQCRTGSGCGAGPSVSPRRVAGRSW